MLDRIHWLGYGGFALLNGIHLYINPWRIARPSQPADFILISHPHYEVCSPLDIDKLRAPTTRVIAAENAAADLGIVEVLRPWQTISAGRLCVKAISAEGRGSSPDGLGFMISLNFHDIYYAGYTELQPEMARIRADIALLPINGASEVEAAADLIATMRPSAVIPYTWGGSSTFIIDAQRLARMVGDKTQISLPVPART